MDTERCTATMTMTEITFHDNRIGVTHLGDMPLHAVADHPALPEGTPVALADIVLVLVVDGGVGGAVVEAGLAADDHVALDAAEHGAANDGGPGVHGLHDLDGGVAVAAVLPPGACVGVSVYGGGGSAVVKCDFSRRYR